MALATTNTIYPVYVYEEGMKLPKDGNYYVVSGNGLWLHKDTGVVRGFVPVRNISMLEDLNADIEVGCNLPKIPEKLVWQIKEFFRRVVEIHHAEAEVTLYYNKEKKDFKIYVPKQKVSHASVNYQTVGLTHIEGMQDYLRVGTIHSHCDFGAFHSGTDHEDESDFDGLHITFGHNNRDEFSISASVVINGTRNKVDPETVLEGIAAHDAQFYVLTSQNKDRQNDEWAQEISQWLEKVEGFKNIFFSSNRLFGNFNIGNIEKGSIVTWKNSSFYENHGEGPFEVQEVEDDKIVINTKIGLLKFPATMFRKMEMSK